MDALQKADYDEAQVQKDRYFILFVLYWKQHRLRAYSDEQKG